MFLVLSSPDWEIFRYGAGTETSQSSASLSTGLGSREWQELFTESVNQNFSHVSEALYNPVWQTPLHPSKPTSHYPSSKKPVTGSIYYEDRFGSQDSCVPVVTHEADKDAQYSHHQGFSLWLLGSSEVQGFPGLWASLLAQW